MPYIRAYNELTDSAAADSSHGWPVNARHYDNDKPSESNNETYMRVQLSNIN